MCGIIKIYFCKIFGFIRSISIIRKYADVFGMISGKMCGNLSIVFRNLTLWERWRALTCDIYGIIVIQLSEAVTFSGIF